MRPLKVGDRVECFALSDGSRPARGTIVNWHIVYGQSYRTYDFVPDCNPSFRGSGYRRRYFRKLSVLELIAEAAQ